MWKKYGKRVKKFVRNSGISGSSRLTEKTFGTKMCRDFPCPGHPRNSLTLSIQETLHATAYCFLSLEKPMLLTPKHTNSLIMAAQVRIDTARTRKDTLNRT